MKNGQKIMDNVAAPFKIISTGIALPPGCVTSAELDVSLGKAEGYVEKRSGIIQRYHSGLDESQAQLGAQALHNALQSASLKSSSGDLLICAAAGLTLAGMVFIA